MCCMRNALGDIQNSIRIQTDAHRYFLLKIFMTVGTGGGGGAGGPNILLTKKI